MINFCKMKYEKSFKYCRRKVHHLDFYPGCAAFDCVDAINTVQDILEWNGMQRVLYKEGDVERKLYKRLLVSSKNIEELEAPRQPPMTR